MSNNCRKFSKELHAFLVSLLGSLPKGRFYIIIRPTQYNIPAWAATAAARMTSSQLSMSLRGVDVMMTNDSTRRLSAPAVQSATAIHGNRVKHRRLEGCREAEVNRALIPTPHTKRTE